MRGLVFMLGLVAGLLVPSTQATARQLSPEHFARDPAISSPVISPGGTHIAFIANPDGTPRILVGEIATGETSSADISAIRPEGVRWVDDRYLLLSASESRGTRYAHGNVDFSVVLALNIENGLESRQLLRHSDDIGRNFHLGRVAGISDDGNVIMPAWDRRGWFSLFSADPSNGRGRLIARGSEFTRSWYLDQSSEPVARQDYANLQDMQRLVFTVDGNRVEAAEIRNATQPQYWGAGMLPDGRFAIHEFASHSESGRAVLRAVDPQSGELQENLAQHPEFDIAGAITDPYNNMVVAAVYTGANFRETIWFDEELEAVFDSLMARLPDNAPPVRLLSWDESRTIFVVAFQFEDAPSAYFLHDTRDDSLTNLGSRYPELEDITLPRRRLISYAASDGTTIPAYLTLPHAEGPYPLVVLPHGGPASRDAGGYDSLAHFLGYRGYAVLQPNFRGSAGYGQAWEASGYGQWGTGVMQTDVSDGVSALVDAGLVASNRICIGGFSYGGYAALAGAAYSPELYACAFGVAGVYDIPEMLEWEEDRYGRFSWVLDYWALTVGGDEDARRREMDRVSPRHAAESMSAPILLIHGRDDSVVPVEQSRMMRSALRRHNNAPYYVELPTGDHWLSRAENRIRVYQEIDAFLSANIGN